MNHFTKLKNYAVSFTQLTGADDKKGDLDDCVRVYRYSPTGVALQIRANTPLETTTGFSGKKKAKRQLTAHVILGKAQIEQIIEALLAESEDIGVDRLKEWQSLAEASPRRA